MTYTVNHLKQNNAWTGVNGNGQIGWLEGILMCKLKAEKAHEGSV